MNSRQSLGAVWLRRFQWKGFLLTFGAFLFPSTLILFAQITWLPLSLLVLVVGLGFHIVAILAGTLVQTLVLEELRGRVTGIYSRVLFGTLPVGALAGGAAAEGIGPQLTVLFGALVMLLFAPVLCLVLPQSRNVEWMGERLVRVPLMPSLQLLHVSLFYHAFSHDGF